MAGFNRVNRELLHWLRDDLRVIFSYGELCHALDAGVVVWRRVIFVFSINEAVFLSTAVVPWKAGIICSRRSQSE